tara:strand:- start:122 stop:757 length:636 start_codon:yes stop_codon:yes gene_type:complete
MKEYYFQINDKQEGPFSLSEVKNLSLNKNTLVWFQDIDEWTELQFITELYLIIKKEQKVPPPIPNNKVLSQIKTEKDKKRKRANEVVNIFSVFKMSLIAGIFFFIGYAIYTELFSYWLFDKYFSYFDAEKIIRYVPEYSFESHGTISGSDRPTGVMTASEEGINEVRQRIVAELAKQSLLFSLKMATATFVLLLIYKYIKRSVNWTKKYSD